jgi:L-ascorbate metabolism protein UlaG (beta-lactamase superfamily)
MKILRLSWAGIQLVVGETTMVIDLLENTTPLKSFMGEPLTEIVPLAGQHCVQIALLTHLHPDHYDPVALRRCLAPAGKVVCHRAIQTKIVADKLLAQGVELEQPFSQGGVTITAVAAVDGFGDPQVSWVVEGGGKKIIHCGDTLWHGHWWKIGRKHGPFDIAFLAINGAVTGFPGMEPSGIPADLTPEQAGAAGKILGAKAICPIHYDTFHFPPLYVQAANAEQTFLAVARARGIPVEIVKPGETVTA